MTDEPAWLVRWRRGEPPLQPPPQPQAAPGQGGKGGTHKARAANGAGRESSGFREPRFEAWRFDGCKRREPVLDLDHNPPRVVRMVGWRVCMRCSTPFWSDDVVRVRMCDECKAAPKGQRRTP